MAVVNVTKDLIMSGYQQTVNKLLRDMHEFTGEGNYNIADMTAFIYGGKTIPVIALEDDFEVGEMGKYDGLFYQKIKDTINGQEFTPTAWRLSSTVDIMEYLKAIEDRIITDDTGLGLQWDTGKSVAFDRSLVLSDGTEPVGYQDAVVVQGVGDARYLYTNDVIGLQFDGGRGVTLKQGTGSSANINGDATNVFDKIEYQFADMDVDDLIFLMSMEGTTQAVGKTLIAELSDLAKNLLVNIFITGTDVTMEIDNSGVITLTALPYELVDGKLHIGIKSVDGEAKFMVGLSEVEISTGLVDESVESITIGYSSKYSEEIDSAYFTGRVIGMTVGEFVTSPFDTDTKIRNLLLNDSFTSSVKNGETRHLRNRIFTGKRIVVDTELENMMWTINETDNLNLDEIVNNEDFSFGEVGTYNGIVYFKTSDGGGTGFLADYWEKFSLKNVLAILTSRSAIISTYLDTASMIADLELVVGGHAFIPIEYKQFRIVDTLEVGHEYETLANGLFAQLEAYTQHINVGTPVLGQMLRYDGTYFIPYAPQKSGFSYTDDITPFVVPSGSTDLYLTFDTVESWSTDGITLSPDGTIAILDPSGADPRVWMFSFKVNMTPQVQQDTVCTFGLEYSLDDGATWALLDSFSRSMVGGSPTSASVTKMGEVPDGSWVRIAVTSTNTTNFEVNTDVVNGLVGNGSAFRIEFFELI